MMSIGKLPRRHLRALARREGVPGAASPGSIGVVIVTHNSAPHISNCLASLPVAAPGSPLRVVLVDNHSEDETVMIARSARPDLQVIEQPDNPGFARAVNRAATLLTDCRYVLLLNPDATLRPGSLETLVAALEATPRAAACGPHLRYPDGRHQISARPLPSLTGVIYDALLLYHLRRCPNLVEQFPAGQEVAEVDCVSGACMLIRRESFDALEGFDERFFLYGEDVDFCARLRALGRTLLVVPAAVVVHVEGASTFRDRALFFREVHRARTQYVRKHFGSVPAALAIGAQVIGLAARGFIYPFGSLMGRPDVKPLARHQWAAALTVLRQAIVPDRPREFRQTRPKESGQGKSHVEGLSG